MVLLELIYRLHGSTDVVDIFRMHSKKNRVAWYWQLRNELSCFSQYLQEHYTRCITRAALSLKNVPGTFFNATHQVKAIAIAVSEVNPLVEIGCLL
jgi:hypothetical protein